MRNKNGEKVTVEFSFSNTGRMLLERFAAKYEMMEEKFIKNALRERSKAEEDSEIGKATYGK